MRGDVVMPGYRNLPDKTAEAVDADGWLHTGDIAEIDDDGYVRIVDRKKEIIINAAGKNMSPANIEATLKASSPLIGQAAVIGDGRPYNTALIVLDADFAPAWAAQQGIAGDLEALADDPSVRDAVQAGVDAANAKLARVEQIKRFHVVRGDWLPGGDELTPTMKLKRRPIAEKYAARDRRAVRGLRRPPLKDRPGAPTDGAWRILRASGCLSRPAPSPLAGMLAATAAAGPVDHARPPVRSVSSPGDRSGRADRPRPLGQRPVRRPRRGALEAPGPRRQRAVDVGEPLGGSLRRSGRQPRLPDRPQPGRGLRLAQAVHGDRPRVRASDRPRA